ncbi:MAG: LPS export ABC transporter permease LptF [Thiotrichaceae bacterium]|nr:LPS export ABC transporter permease LptF [Thiotrichaceae bacterium]
MIIQRYIAKEILWSFIATMLVLLLIIVGNTFVRLLAKVSTGELPLDILSQLVLLSSVNGALQLVPIALLIGMMLAFGRLYQDHEMEAMSASGAGPKVFYKGIAHLLIPLTITMAGLVLFVVPWVEGISNEVRIEVKQRPEASGIPIGEFLQLGQGSQSTTLFVEALEKEQVMMERFFMHSESKGQQHFLVAGQAILFVDKFSGERMLQINDGSRYSRDLKTGAFSVFRFEEHGFRIPPLDILSSVDLDAVSTMDLLKINNRKSMAEFHWRIAVVLATPVMAFIAFPLSFSRPRQGKFGRLALGILVFAIYFNLLITAVSFIEKGSMPVAFGLWWVHLIFIGIGAFLLKHYYGSRKVKQ